jgi:hypothetical protein
VIGSAGENLAAAELEPVRTQVRQAVIGPDRCAQTSPADTTRLRAAAGSAGHCGLIYAAVCARNTTLVVAGHPVRVALDRLDTLPVRRPF